MNVVIVGASSSIGEPVVGAFAAEGAKVLGTWASEPAPPRPGCRLARLDLLDDASIQTFAQQHLLEMAPVDVLIVLSGVIAGTALAEYDFDGIERVMGINATGVAKLLSACLPSLGEGSSILLASSISAQAGSHDPVYAASKGALISLTRALAGQLAPRTRVNALAPGLIEGSRMWSDMTPERRAWHAERTPTGALLRAEDLARVIVDLTRPHWRHLNGAVIPLNGGARV